MQVYLNAHNRLGYGDEEHFDGMQVYLNVYGRKGISQYSGLASESSTTAPPKKYYSY